MDWIDVYTFILTAAKHYSRYHQLANSAQQHAEIIDFRYDSNFFRSSPAS